MEGKDGEKEEEQLRHYSMDWLKQRNRYADEPRFGNPLGKALLLQICDQFIALGLTIPACVFILNDDVTIVLRWMIESGDDWFIDGEGKLTVNDTPMPIEQAIGHLLDQVSKVPPAGK
jgi:hypothetical protein